MRIACKLFLALAFLSFASSSGHSQDAHYPYPFSVECSSIPIPAGESAKFTVKFPNADDEKVNATWSWYVSAGVIESGQGTPEITVRSFLGGETITATVQRDLGGRDWVGTQKSGSCSIEVIQALPQLVDEFALIGTSCEHGNWRLDSYFNDLANNPNDAGVIVIYGSPKSLSAASHREGVIRNFTRLRRFDPTRIEFVHGPFRENAMVQFWRVPPGASKPEILPANVDAQPPRPASAASKPYLYATEYLDGLPECEVPMYDLAAFSEVLKDKPGSRGKIVIGEPTRASFARKQREVLAEMSANGVARNRLTFIYKYVRPNRAREMTELWVIPARKK